MIMKRCHHYPTLVASIDSINYYCADLEGSSAYEGKVIVNLTGIGNIPNPSKVPQELSEHVESNINEIVIPWADFGPPRVKNSFWPALHGYLKKIGVDEVCIHCEGGHGRTGTAMSALLVSVVGWSAKEAVEWVRDNHCREAVETPEQCEYLCALDIEYNDRKILEDEAPMPSLYISWDDSTTVEEQEDEETEEESEDVKNAGWQFNDDGERSEDYDNKKEKEDD